MALRIVEALDAYLRAADGGTETAEQTAGSFAELKRARADMTFATPEQIERAKDDYGLFACEDIEVDEGALTSQADDGVWVQGWLWLKNTEEG
jgi:hypothetical protein